MKKSRFIYTSIIIAVAASLMFVSCKSDDEETVKIGLLHSTTGSMAIREESDLNAELMAIAEINNAGGVLGRKIEVVQENGESDAAVFAKKAEKLISEDNVVSIFGCWTSDSRITTFCGTRFSTKAWKQVQTLFMSEPVLTSRLFLQ